MVGQPSPVALAYLFAAALTVFSSVAVSVYVYLHHWETQGAKSFVLMTGMGTVWVATMFVHVLVTEPALLPVILKFEFLAAMANFSTVGVFVSRYTGRNFHRRLPFQAGYTGAVVGQVVLALTEPWHELLYRDITVVTEPFVYATFKPQAGQSVIVALSLCIVVYSSYVLVSYLLSSSGLTEMQLVLPLVGFFSVAAIEIAGNFGAFPADRFHHAGFGVIAFNLLMTLSLFRYRFFHIKPVARNAVVETLQDPVLVLDDDRRVVDANRQATDVWPAIRSKLSDPFSEACPVLSDSVTLPTDTTRTATRLTLPAGDDQRHYSAHVSAVRQGQSEEWYAVVLRDVTTLEQSRWQLEQQNERLNQVASAISHDLRNPINIINGNVKLLEADLEEQEINPAVRDTIENRLGTVNRATGRMEEIIDDILTIAREGETVEETQQVSLETIAEEGWSNVDTGEATLVVTNDAAFEADRSKLLSIFENLMRNSIDHGPTDVTVEVGTTDEGFYLADDGPGIPESHRDSIFEYGYTTSGEGTGLGLSIVRTMAASHNWTVELDGEGDGARFVFWTINGTQSGTPRMGDAS